MFKLSIQTTGIFGPYSWDDTYRLIAEAGFESADANLDQLFPFTKVKVREPIPKFFRKETSDMETLEHFKPIREAAENTASRISRDTRRSPRSSSTHMREMRSTMPPSLR